MSVLYDRVWVSDLFVGFVGKCLEKDASKRYGLS